MIKGILFDFNGTLFWDSLLHDKAWIEFTTKKNLRVPTVKEMRTHIHGKGAADIMEYVFNKKLSQDEVHELTQEKEAIYRDMVCADNTNSLAPGAIDLLNFLKSINFPITIATSSERVNVDFFFKHFALGTWFDREKTICDNGKFELKPAPDIFLFAAEKINVPISDCLIIEDSPSGLLAAKNAGARTVAYIENNSPVDYNKIKHLVDLKINSLDEIIELIEVPLLSNK